MTQMPQVYQADEAATEALFQQHAAESASRGGTFAQWLKFLGPNGEKRWTSVPQGYKATVIGFLCPPSADGKPVYVKSQTHFYKSPESPQGTTIGCGGIDRGCKICMAREPAMSNPDSRIQQLAKQWCRVRTQYVWNIIDLSTPTNNQYKDGVIRPLLYGMGENLKNDIEHIKSHCGGINAICNPQSGRPISFIKHKTGPEEMNVEYSAIHMDPKPLDQYFWPALQNLWDLESQCKLPSEEEMLKAVVAIGLPIVGQGQSFGQVPASYAGPAPVPPGPNPYQQPAPVPPPQQQVAMPPQQQVPVPPQQPAMAPPPPPAPVAPQQNPWGPPPGNMAPPPPPTTAPAQPGAPMMPPPPPLTSQPAPAAGTPQMQPGAGGPPDPNAPF
jgi:hypothetical protein